MAVALLLLLPLAAGKLLVPLPAPSIDDDDDEVQPNLHLETGGGATRGGRGTTSEWTTGSRMIRSRATRMASFVRALLLGRPTTTTLFLASSLLFFLPSSAVFAVITVSRQPMVNDGVLNSAVQYS